MSSHHAVELAEPSEKTKTHHVAVRGQEYQGVKAAADINRRVYLTKELGLLMSSLCNKINDLYEGSRWGKCKGRKGS
jgi:hypothetical protein